MSSRRPPKRTLREPKEFDVPIKLWVSRSMFDQVDARAKDLDWTRPQVIRRCVLEALARRLV